MPSVPHCFGAGGQADRAKYDVGCAVVPAHADWQTRAAAHFVIERSGGEAAGQLMSLLADNGELISFGSLTFKPLVISGGNLIFRARRAAVRLHAAREQLAKARSGPGGARRCHQALDRAIGSKPLEGHLGARDSRVRGGRAIGHVQAH